MALQPVGEVRRRLQKRWDRGIYLADTAPVGRDDAFPLRESVGSVTAQALHKEYETVRAAAAEYRALEKRAGVGGAAGTAGLTVEWTQRNDRRIGTNSVPAALHFPTIDTLARFLGTAPARQLATYRAAAARLLDEFSALHGWIAARPLRLIELSEPLEQLIAVTRWIVEHPQPGIYIRQIPVDGIDTKFVEGHTGTLTEWWDALLPDTDPAREESVRDDGAAGQATGRFVGRGKAAFARRYGFQVPPETVRFRLLDPGTTSAGYTDLRVLLGEFAARRPDGQPPGSQIAESRPTEIQSPDGSAAPYRVFIVENEITGLAFPPVANAIVIFGGGYSVGWLAGIGWLADVPVYYWGDIDTHGFAILNRLRAGHRHTTSLLMDRETLDTHRSRWSREPQQATGELPHLTPEETRLYEDLKHDRLGTGVRLEQERIDYSRVTAAITRALHRDRSGR